MKKLLLLLVCLFLAAPALAGAELPADLTEIAEGAFDGDASLNGVMKLSSLVKTVGDRAFAGTSICALEVSASCENVGADVLADTGAMYLLLRGADTAVAAATLDDVRFVLAPAGHSAASLASWRDLDGVVTADGMLYSTMADGTLSALCARNAAGLAPELTLPKFVGNAALSDVSCLMVDGAMSAVKTINVPDYLAESAPAGANVTTTEYMTLTAPVLADTGDGNDEETGDAGSSGSSGSSGNTGGTGGIGTTARDTTLVIGTEYTWTTEIAGAYGDVTYTWTFTTGTAVQMVTTSEPTVTFAPQTAGDCVVSVTAADAVGDTASAAAAAISVTTPAPRYRALIIGNTYPNTQWNLPGCDTDASSIRTMLSGMTGSRYTTTVLTNQNANQIRNAVNATFTGATEYDVSLFYFSGHGTSDGALVGTGTTTSLTYLYPATLRQAMDRIPGTKIVILDCCYSGAFISRGDAPSPAAFNSAVISAFSWKPKGDNDLAAAGYHVITACSMTQTSSSLSFGNGKSFGAFTYGLCYGSGYDILYGSKLSNLPADSNGDGGITVAETLPTIREKVAFFNESLVAAGYDPMEQNVQSYTSDGSFHLWHK